ncbi:MAG: hypothetical protein ACI9XO_001806 [Paraglaciecola sp.]|jgi:uncharacterized protein (DUF488 family)
MKKTIYTIGHSIHEFSYFLTLLSTYQIDCIVDVRSIPASGRNPQYNKAALQNTLRAEDIIYLHFGKEFGARQPNQAVQNNDGQVNFEKFRQTQAFQKGIQQLEEGLEKGYNIALMCSESHPLDCHRFSMISNFLVEQSFEVQHILKDKSLVSHEEMEERMLKKYAKKLPKPSLFEPDISEEDQVAAAYRLHNCDIGWRAG